MDFLLHDYFQGFHTPDVFSTSGNYGILRGMLSIQESILSTSWDRIKHFFCYLFTHVSTSAIYMKLLNGTKTLPGSPP